MSRKCSGFARSDRLRLCRTEKPRPSPLFSLKVAFAGSRWSNGGVLPAADNGDSPWRGDRHCLTTRKPDNRPLGARSERVRPLSVIGPLLRLLGRFDPRDAAAYEAAAREAFKAATPTDVPTTTPAVDTADLLGPRDASSPGPFSQPALPQGPTTTRRSGSLGSQPTTKPRGSDSSTGGGPAIEGGASGPEVPGSCDDGPASDPEERDACGGRLFRWPDSKSRGRALDAAHRAVEQQGR